VILSNTQIVECIKKKRFTIEPLEGVDPTKTPFNTSAVDLRLGEEIRVQDSDSPIQIDLRKGGIADFLVKNSKLHKLEDERPFSLKPRKLILANTFEKVNFPINPSDICYSARVEGKSSLARCGIIVHFTAPTIHSNFSGKITLEIINFSEIEFLLFPKMYICQLIIEEIRGCPAIAPNQFSGQTDPAGTKT
jgi:dCTP deaminase